MFRATETDVTPLDSASSNDSCNTKKWLLKYHSSGKLRCGVDAISNFIARTLSETFGTLYNATRILRGADKLQRRQNDGKLENNIEVV